MRPSVAPIPALLLPAVLTLGCTAPGGGAGPAPTDSGATGGDDGGDDDDGVVAEPPTPLWTPAEAAAATEAALADGLPSPVLLHDTWRTLIDEGGDAACPGPDEMAQADLEGCTSASGHHFMGLAVVEDHGALGGDADWIFTADFEIRDPEGRAYQAGGSASHQRFHEGGGTRTFVGEVEGTWRWEATDGWLGAGTSAILRAEGIRALTTARVTLDGVATVQGVSLDFDEVTVDEGRCEGHPRGAISIRDPAGAWRTLDYGDGCDSCGEVRSGDEVLGEACLDLRAAALALAEDLGR